MGRGGGEGAEAGGGRRRGRGQRHGGARGRPGRVRARVRGPRGPRARGPRGPRGPRRARRARPRAPRRRGGLGALHQARPPRAAGAVLSPSPPARSRPPWRRPPIGLPESRGVAAPPPPSSRDAAPRPCGPSVRRPPPFMPPPAPPPPPPSAGATPRGRRRAAPPPPGGTWRRRPGAMVPRPFRRARRAGLARGVQGGYIRAQPRRVGAGASAVPPSPRPLSLHPTAQFRALTGLLLRGWVAGHRAKSRASRTCTSTPSP